MAAKTVFVDVGTHEAQEYLALFGHSPLTYLRHRLRHRRRCRRAGMTAINFSGYRNFLATVAALRQRRERVIYVMVEPNSRLFALAQYRNANIGLNVALSTDAAVASVKPLYLAKSNPTGQGSSLFTEKPNVRPDEFDLVLNLDADHFARMISDVTAEHSGAGAGPVILRLNNEGAETEVIRAFHQMFGPRLKVVMGSLSDVAKVKGADALVDLHRFLESNGIPFLPFHSDFATWPAAAEKTLALLDV